MIKIAMTDDHPMMIEGLQHALSGYSEIVVTGAYSGSIELFDGLEKQMPDVLLLDIEMPGQKGTDIAPRLLKKYPELKIIMLTNIEMALYACNLLKQGIHGYLLKSADRSIIKQAIETVFEGGSFIDPLMSEKIKHLDHKIKRATSHRSSLTPREIEVVRLIANGDTTREIAQKLYLSEGTVENYRSTILLKLDAKNNVVLIKKAILNGLIDS